MDKLHHARGAFTDLLNALDEAREDVHSDEAEDVLDALLAQAEALCRRFDAAFGREE